MDWVEKHRISCIVLVSYGTVSNYDATQLDENHNGLCNFAQPFFRDVRSDKSHKLSVELKVKCMNNGSIVAWYPHLEVLSHKAIDVVTQNTFVLFLCTRI